MSPVTKQQIQDLWDQLDSDGQKCWGGAVDAIMEEDYQVYHEWALRYLASEIPPQPVDSSLTPENIVVVPEMTILAYGSDCTNAHSDAGQYGCVNEDLLALYEFDQPGWSDDYGSYDLTAGANPPTMTGYGLVGSDMPTFTDGTGYGFGLGNADVPLSSKTDFTIAFFVAGTNSPSDYTLICGGSKIDIIYDPYLLKYRFTVGHGVGAEYVQTDDAGNADFNITRFVVCRRDDTHLSISMRWSGGSSFDCIEHSLGTSYVDLQGFGICDLDFDGFGIGSDTVTGVIDEVAIWQRCLSQSEVDWLWGGGSGRILSQFLCGGNLLAGGSAAIGGGWHETAHEGGVDFSGNAVAGGSITLTGDGGAVAGGVANLSIPYLEVAHDGGLEFSGLAIIDYNLIMDGGSKAGGSAVIGGHWHEYPLGSGLLFGTGSYDNGYDHKYIITIPAGMVTEDLEGYPVMYTDLVDPTHVYTGTDFAVTDDSTASLATEFIGYAEATGRVHLSFLTATLDASSDNVFWLFCGRLT